MKLSVSRGASSSSLSYSNLRKIILCSALLFPPFFEPGVFGTVEMYPSHVGIWRVDCKVGEHQQAGMSALFLVYDLSE